MKCQIALLVVCFAVMAKAVPIGPVVHGEPNRLVIHDPTGHTVYGGGDENRDFIPDAADTNRDGKADAVVQYHAVPAYHVPVYHGVGYAHPVAYGHGGYFPYHHGAYYGGAAFVH